MKGLFNFFRNTVYARALLDDPFEFAKRQLLIRLYATIVVPIVAFLVCILLGMGAGAALSELLQDTWDSLDRSLFGEYITDETTFEEYCDQPEVLLHSLNFDRFDYADSGYFMVTKDDFKKILQAVVDYETSVNHSCGINARYYHHWFNYSINSSTMASTSNTSEEERSKESVSDTKTFSIDHGLTKTDYDTYTVESIEDSDEYRINWQEVYAFAVLASIDDSVTEWEDLYVEVDTDEDGVNDSYQVQPVKRIDETTLDTIIARMQYSFNYWHDASRGNQGGPSSYSQTYEYDDMENYAYEEYESGTEGHSGCSEENLIDVDCSPANVFDYIHKKLPRTAPNYAQNAFKTVIWYYNESTRVMESKRTYADPQDFIDFGKEVCGSENFDFDWYVDLVDMIPGGNLPDGSDRFEDMHNLYDAYKMGSVIDSYDYLADGIGTVKLGANIGYIAPGSSNQNGNNYILNYNGNGAMNIPYDIDASDIYAYAKKSLRISDNLTLEQLTELLGSICPNTAIYNGRSGFLEYQQEYGCSVIGVVAIMMYESGHGTSPKSMNLWNFSGMKSYSGDPYDVNGWHSFKLQVETEYPNLSMDEKQGKAVYLQCKRVYDSHINRGNGADARDNYYEFNARAPVYCGNAAMSEEGMRWTNTVARMRKQYEMVLNLATNDASVSGTVSTVKGEGVGVDVCNYALQFVGNPYVYGGNSLTNGIDCSGFTKAVYAQYGVALPRTSVAQRTVGVEVRDRSALKPGDLICYDATTQFSSSHVAIYIGNGQVVHAAGQRSGIKVSNAFYRHVCTMRRVVN